MMDPKINQVELWVGLVQGAIDRAATIFAISISMPT
jgi:hypothetical protein